MLLWSARWKWARKKWLGGRQRQKSNIREEGRGEVKMEKQTGKKLRIGEK